jgi:hypothetical protein
VTRPPAKIDLIQQTPLPWQERVFLLTGPRELHAGGQISHEVGVRLAGEIGRALGRLDGLLEMSRGPCRLSMGWGPFGVRPKHGQA